VEAEQIKLRVSFCWLSSRRRPARKASHQNPLILQRHHRYANTTYVYKERDRNVS